MYFSLAKKKKETQTKNISLKLIFKKKIKKYKKILYSSKTEHT